MFSNFASAGEVPFYIGTFTDHSASKGIYLSSIETDTGKLGPLSVAVEASSPNFLAFTPNHKFLYAVTGKPGDSGVAAYIVNPDGTLKLLNEQSLGAPGACYVSVDKTGHDVLIANYDKGYIACFKIQPDGSLGERTAFVPFTGSGPNRVRQNGAYAHSIYTDEANKFVYSCDLGSDNVWSFKFDAVHGAFTPNDPPSSKVPPGGGPRHLAFHPNGKFVYVANELGVSITGFSRDAASGVLTPIETVPTLPKDISPQDVTVAEIVCHPSGRWLYVSNRLCDTLSVFAIANDGRLSLIQSTPSVVRFPRNFALDPTGRWLIAAGQKDNRIAVFKIDPTTGQLTPTDQVAEVGGPVCILFKPK